MAQNPKFCGSIIGALDIARITEPNAQLVLRAVWTIHKEMGNGPSSPMTVIQRLTRLMDEGAVTREQLIGAGELLIDTDIQSPTEPEFLNEVVPILKRKAQAEIVSEMALAFGSRGDLSALATKLQRAESIGLVDRSIGDELTADTIASLPANQSEVCPTGVEELDLVIDGGMARQCVGIILAPTSGGKSMFLCHVACTALRRRLNVAVATLELAMERWRARVLANLTGVPSNAIINGLASELAMEKFKAKSASLGRFFPKRFPADVTTLEDVLLWVEELEQAKGISIDMLVIDYVVKMKHDVGTAAKLVPGHQIGASIDRFRNYAAAKNKLGYTGAQARRGDPKDAKKKLKNEDVGDSYRQVQNADLVISMVKSEDNTEATFHVAKNRNERGEGETVGPLPTNFACGRVAPIFDED